MAVRSATAAVALVMLAIPAMAQNTNKPIPGIDIIVQREPGGSALRVGATNARGQVDFVAEAGGIALLLPAVQACREAARRSSAGSSPPGGVIARVEVGRMVQTSAPLMFDSRDPGRFMGPDGREMVVAIPREGARVRVTLVPCCWAAEPRGPARRVPEASGL